MTIITVNELFEEIANITSNKHSWDTVEWRVEYYKKCIDFYDEENSHLKNKLNDFERQFYPVARKEGDYLTGNEIVNGNCFLFYYCGHDGFGFVRNFENIEDLEKVVYKYGRPNSKYFYTEELSVLVDDNGECEVKIYVNGH